MQRSRTILKLFKKETLVTSCIFWLAALFFYLAYHGWGVSLIGDIYHQRSLPFLNAMLAGRDNHSLEFYYMKADGLVYTVMLGLFLVPFLYPLAELWINRGGPDQVKSLRVLISIFPISFIALLIYMKIEYTDQYRQIFMKEDGIAEYLTSVVYFIAFCFALCIAVRFLKMNYLLYAIMYFVLSGGLFFISMEEISWGQRLVGIETPEVFAKHNIQGEMNIHNLLSRYPLHFLYIFVGFYGAFSRILVPKQLFKRYPILADLMTPNYFLVLYFFPTFALYMYHDYASTWAVSWFGPQMGTGAWEEGYFVGAKDQEPIELLLGLGFLLFVVINRYRQLHPCVKWTPFLLPRSTSNNVLVQNQ